MMTENKPSIIGNPKKSIGYVELLDGSLRYIHPLHTLLLSYTFKEEKNWKYLKDLINIYLEAYREFSSDVELIDDNIIVEAEYEYWINKDEKTKRQDFKIDDKKKITYVEIQNSIYSKPPIPDRAIQYFGLGLGKKAGETSNQIWLLADKVEELLQGLPFARYKLYNEINKNPYPNSSYIMFINLKALADRDNSSKVSEISKFLLQGDNIVMSNDVSKDIANAIKRSFYELKQDREVLQAMTSLEFMKLEGREEGEQIGLVKGLYNFLDGNVDKIVEHTKIDREYVEKIIQELKAKGKL